MPTKTTLFAAALALSANTAFAGGLSPEIIEADTTDNAVAAAAPSIDPAYIVVGVLAVLLIAAAVGNGDDDEEVVVAPPPEPSRTSGIQRTSARVN